MRTKFLSLALSVAIFGAPTVEAQNFSSVTSRLMWISGSASLCTAVLFTFASDTNPSEVGGDYAAYALLTGIGGYVLREWAQHRENIDRSAELIRKKSPNLL